MTSGERRTCMRLLARAKDNDSEACGQLAEIITQHFSYMIRGFHSVDPAFDRDDLISQFQLGVWQAIPKVDGRGDPLFHLAWRGQRAVCSLLNVIKQRRHGTEQWVKDFGEERSIGTLPEGWDLVDTRPEAELDHALLVKDGQEEARRHVIYLLSQTRLTQRQHDVVDWMATDPDIMGKGANLRLARKLGVSPQAAGVLYKRVMTLLSGIDQTLEPQFECLACGGMFLSKGALTQHRNGQSGHRPCQPQEVA